ncbi:AzlC family ABC transporter permease [Tetragenococcus halophilus]|uniref:AzlC family ABC transporter permease n=1 Tax=Tetragenococcus halophilus TaxID=51669 RepID=UPI0030F261CF
MEEVKYETFVDGMKACVPTILGYLGIGFALGVVGKGVGLSVFAIFLMSVIVYAGSAQFIICGLIAIQAPITSIIATVFLVNLRHFLMSLSVAPYFRQASLLENVGIGTLLTDESYGVLTMALKRMGKVSVAWTNGLNICAYLTWIVATVLGGLLGNFIPEPEIFGLDFALVAMFLGLFLFQVEIPLKSKTRQTLLVLLSVILVLYLLMWLTTPEIAVIVSALVGCLVGVITHDKY